MTLASQFDGLPGGWLAPKRTLLLVGHLPVMSGLWLSQYADREAREHGPVCLVRVFADSVQIEVFRAGSRRPSIHPQAKYDEALRAIAPIVSQWLIVPRHAEPVDIPQGTDEVVVLTGADQAAIVAAYRLVKGANDAADRIGTARPSLSVAVLGADSAETAHVAARIGEVAGASLSIQVPVRGGLQRVAPAESSFRGTFDDPAPSLLRICEIIAGTLANPMRAASPVAASAVAPLASLSSDGPLRFAPRAERKAPAARVGGMERTTPERHVHERPVLERSGPERSSPERSNPERSNPERFAPTRPLPERAPSDTAHGGRSAPADAIPFRAELPSRVDRGDEPFRSVPPRTPPVERMPPVAASQSAPREEMRSRGILADASSVLRDASAALREAVTAGATTRATANYSASAVAGPSVAPPVARIVEGGLPESLVPFVAGLERIDHVAPRCERIEFAVEQGGRLHLVCRVDDLRMLERARTWLRENSALFRRAYPEIVTADDPAIDVFVQDLRDLDHIEGATIRVIRQLEFAGRRCFDVQTLSA
jgi:hypothetical protein